jgi:hypothetical protein
MSEVATEKTARVIWKCRYTQCKHVFAFDYQRDTDFESEYLYRLLEDGTRRYLQDDFMGDLRCPLCTSYLPKGTRVNGHYSAKRACSARCLSATGPDCDCQCAGASHGANHLA